MNRNELVQAVRRRALELAISDPNLNLRDAERQAALELKRSLATRGAVATPAKKAGSARVRLSSTLAAISSRMATAAAIVPRALTPAPAVEEAPSGGGRSMPDERTPPTAAAPEPEPSDVVLLYAGRTSGAQLINDEFPPDIQLQNWKRSIADNARRLRDLGRSS